MSAAFAVPVIETERLRLRGRTIDDFPFIRDMWADPVTTKFIGGSPLTEEASWTKFLRMLGHWPALGFGYWIVEERATGCTVGETGFADFKRDIEPSLHGQLEMGWAFAPAFHGRGYAGEAARAAVDWGEKNFPDRRMSCIIAPDNAPSIRVAEKLGFSLGAKTKYHGDDALVMYRDAKG
jgi:RimJ/RimL family protein N-acetyltransferase